MQLGIAGVLADCGMAKIDPSIIEKSAFLTNEEFNEVKKHTIYSYQMIKDTPLIRQEMKIAIVQHHERLDGSGYPRGDKIREDNGILSNTCYCRRFSCHNILKSLSCERVLVQST